MPSSEPCSLGRLVQPSRTSRTGCTSKIPCKGRLADCRLDEPAFGPLHKHKTSKRHLFKAMQQADAHEIMTTQSWG